jgi:phage/plasmid-associated DNA primase
MTTSDLEFIKSFCDRFVPVKVELDSTKGKHTKVPVISKWTSITPEKSKKYKSKDWRHFMFVVGEESGLFVVDMDRKNPDRQDHDGKIDGIEFFEDWCGPVSAPDTFTSRTISGGYHKVYLYTPELDGMLKSGQLTPLALCDIMFNSRGFTFGEGYKIINRVLPKSPPKSVINFIVNNNNTVNIGTINQQNNIQQNIIAGALGTSTSVSLSQRINDILGIYETTWHVNKLENAAYQLIPKTRECMVQQGHIHTTDSHSCIYVYRTSVVCNCFSHGKKSMYGVKSRLIREIFFDMAEDSSKGVMVKIVNELCYIAREQNLVRENGCVLRRVDNTYAYEYVDLYKNFVRYTLCDNMALKDRPQRFNELMIYMNNIDSVDFPFVKRNKRYLGFANGLLDIVSGELVNDHVLEHGVIPRHYINQNCDLEIMETPLLDKILRHQLESDEIYTYMLAFIGRLFYDVGQYDSFDIIPFIIGDSNTGKSTLVDIIRAMFYPNSVGVLDSSHEMVFGLQSKHNKELIVAPEITDRMAMQLASDMFKKMVCGELVNLPIKHSEATSVQWKVPMFMCGNKYINYNDDRGSISKRLAIFKFDKHVTHMDDSLRQQIIDKELAQIVVKSLSAYRMLLEHAGISGFWSTCIDYFKETRDEMNQSTDYIYMFLTLGPDENAWSNKVMYFVKVNDQCMMLEDFKRKFINYMRFRHPNVKYKWDQDLSAFKRLGYEIVYTKVCRACLQEARKNCCKNYDHANRSTRRIIKHIMCIEHEV